MNASPLRGAAVLALLCLLPRVSALTISQTASFDLSRSAFLEVRLNPEWASQPFDPSLGTLNSATIQGAVTGRVSVSGRHDFAPYNGPLPPMVFTPSILLDVRAYYITATHAISTQESASAQGQPTLLNYNEGLSFSHVFDVPFSLTITNADTFGGRVGASLTATGYAAYHEHIFADLTTNFELIYSYSAPDTGSTLAMMAAGLCVLAFHRRRDPRLRKL